MHALLGHNNPTTLRIMGKKNNKNVTILIDSGSTHNFIQERIVRFLNLQISPAHKFHLVIGNGDQLTCTKQCLKVLVILHNTIFSHRFFYPTKQRGRLGHKNSMVKNLRTYTNQLLHLTYVVPMERSNCLPKGNS